MSRIKFDRSLIPASPDLVFELACWSSGADCVAGLDEAGRGALAGPVAAAAVVLPATTAMLTCLHGVRDSKEMSPEDRAAWAEQIRQTAHAWGVGWGSAEEIDRLGIAPATRLAMRRAVEALSAPPNHLLIDFVSLPELSIPQTSLVKGDARSLSIAAASVLAKTARDEVMRALDETFPGYGFAAHKGYGTAAHCRALAEYGPCAIHRRSFAPLARS